MPYIKRTFDWSEFSDILPEQAIEGALQAGAKPSAWFAQLVGPTRGKTVFSSTIAVRGNRLDETIPLSRVRQDLAMTDFPTRLIRGVGWGAGNDAYWTPGVRKGKKSIWATSPMKQASISSPKLVGKARPDEFFFALHETGHNLLHPETLARKGITHREMLDLDQFPGAGRMNWRIERLAWRKASVMAYASGVDPKEMAPVARMALETYAKQGNIPMEEVESEIERMMTFSTRHAKNTEKVSIRTAESVEHAKAIIKMRRGQSTLKALSRLNRLL